MGFLAILEELGWPEIYLVSPLQFKQIDGDTLGSDCGNSNSKHRCITVHPGLRGKVRENTLWHEIGHVLWPHKPEWWITFFGLRMARGGGIGSEAWMRGHTIDELPPRAELLKRARRAAERMNG